MLLMLQYIWEMKGKEHAIERNFTMNNDEVKLLSQMKKAINNGNKSFYQRKDRDYLLDLSNLGISLEEAWKEILTLNKHFCVLDKKPIYKQSSNHLIFKKIINGKKTYIKLVMDKDENGNDFVYCWSFHEDGE